MFEVWRLIQSFNEFAICNMCFHKVHNSAKCEANRQQKVTQGFKLLEFQTFTL